MRYEKTDGGIVYGFYPGTELLSQLCFGRGDRGWARKQRCTQRQSRTGSLPSLNLFPRYGKLTITCSSIAGSGTGSKIHAGILNLSGDVEFFGGVGKMDAEENIGRLTPENAALAISQYEDMPIEVNITDGTLTSRTFALVDAWGHV